MYWVGVFKQVDWQYYCVYWIWLVLVQVILEVLLVLVLLCVQCIECFGCFVEYVVGDYVQCYVFEQGFELLYCQLCQCEGIGLLGQGVECYEYWQCQ